MINVFELTSFTCLLIDKAFAEVYNLKLRFYFANNMFLLLKIKKNILKITFILMLATKNIF